MLGFSNLSRKALGVLQTASAASRNHEHWYVGVEHLLLALCQVSARHVTEIMDRLGIDRRRLREQLREFLDNNPVRTPGQKLTVTPRTERIMDLAGDVAELMEREHIDSGDILQAILLEARSLPFRLMREHAMDFEQPEAIDELSEETGVRSAESELSSGTEGEMYLNEYGSDLTELARQGELSTLIGRRNEMLNVVRILARHEYSHPLIVGDPGVGKTCIVEGLAQLAIDEDGPRAISGKRIFQLSPATLLGGTAHRGEFEMRFNNLLEEAENCQNVILFFDEIHTLMGAGAAGAGALDATNILKPALERGRVTCIGATTIDEYHQYIAEDGALTRRFELVTVDEPTVQETVEILSGIKGELEEHHGVMIEDAALEQAVYLSKRYIAERFVPDKAISVLDRACTAVTIGTLTPGRERSGEHVVTRQALAGVVSEMTGIPVHTLTAEQADALLGIQQRMAQRVVGQDEALRKVAECVIAGRELASPDRPDGVLLFIGPTGVGKTEVARTLARELFGSEQHLVRVDMTEYRERHNVARLIGSPPGYVGHEQQGQLTGAIRRRPYSIVLLDEFEKAHPDVVNTFMQVFDDARLTDGKGRTIDFSNTIIILTSNIGGNVEKQGRIGFGAQDGPNDAGSQSRNAHNDRVLREAFPPELINRFDEIVQFRTLQPDAVRAIVDILLEEINDELGRRQLTLKLEDELTRRLAEIGYNDTFCARELRRVMDRQVRKPLARYLLENDPEPGQVVTATLHNENVQFHVATSDSS